MGDKDAHWTCKGRGSCGIARAGTVPAVGGGRPPAGIWAEGHGGGGGRPRGRSQSKGKGKGKLEGGADWKAEAERLKRDDESFKGSQAQSGSVVPPATGAAPSSLVADAKAAEPTLDHEKRASELDSMAATAKSNGDTDTEQILRGRAAESRRLARESLPLGKRVAKVEGAIAGAEREHAEAKAKHESWADGRRLAINQLQETFEQEFEESKARVDKKAMRAAKLHDEFADLSKKLHEETEAEGGDVAMESRGAEEQPEVEPSIVDAASTLGDVIRHIAHPLAGP